MPNAKTCKKQNKKTSMTLCCQMSSRQWTSVALGNNAGEPQQKKRETEVVDIYVNSQGSRLALEMAED